MAKCFGNDVVDGVETQSCCTAWALLWNIVNRTMSLGGLRPFPEYHVSRLRSDFGQLRTAVRADLTGMWRLMVCSDRGLREQERYDTHYIRNWSLWFDIYMLI